MQPGIELKYIILFAILIALTGFTFESQIDFNTDLSVDKDIIPLTTLSASANP